MNPTSRQPVNMDTLEYRVGQLEDDVVRMEAKHKQDIGRLYDKVDKLTWALITLTVTIAGSAVVFAITVASAGGR